MTVPTKLRLTALLWFAASAASAAAVLITYIQESQIEWLLLAGSTLMAVLGINSLRRSTPTRNRFT